MLTIFLGILSLWFFYLLIISILNSIMQYQEYHATSAFTKFLRMRLFEIKAEHHCPESRLVIETIESLIHKFETDRIAYKHLLRDLILTKEAADKIETHIL